MGVEIFVIFYHFLSSGHLFENSVLTRNEGHAHVASNHRLNDVIQILLTRSGLHFDDFSRTSFFTLSWLKDFPSVLLRMEPYKSDDCDVTQQQIAG